MSDDTKPRKAVNVDHEAIGTPKMIERQAVEWALCLLTIFSLLFVLAVTCVSSVEQFFRMFPP